MIAIGRVFKLTGFNFDNQKCAVSERCALENPCGLALDSGKLYVATAPSNHIMVYSIMDSSLLSQIQVPDCGTLHSIAVGNGTMHTSDYTQHSVHSLNLCTNNWERFIQGNSSVKPLD